jgi:hypothetical protein
MAMIGRGKAKLLCYGLTDGERDSAKKLEMKKKSVSIAFASDRYILAHILIKIHVMIWI